MGEWTSEELSKIETAEELTLRSVNGRNGWWFRGTQMFEQGHIGAGGVAKDVSFVSVEPGDDVGEKIDAAYRAKYRRYSASIVNTVLTPEARAATLELVPNAP